MIIRKLFIMASILGDNVKSLDYCKKTSAQKMLIMIKEDLPNIYYVFRGRCLAFQLRMFRACIRVMTFAEL